VSVRIIRQADSDYPAVLQNRLGDDAPPQLVALGETAVLRRRLLGLICSIQCPGSIVIKTFDAIRALRDAGMATVGGFLSPMEQDCLDILLRGRQPIVLCPARGLKGLRRGTSGSLRLPQRQDLDRRPCRAEKKTAGIYIRWER
jgi:hypothetical protein